MPACDTQAFTDKLNLCNYQVIYSQPFKTEFNSRIVGRVCEDRAVNVDHCGVHEPLCDSVGYRIEEDEQDDDADERDDDIHDNEPPPLVERDFGLAGDSLLRHFALLVSECVICGSRPGGFIGTEARDEVSKGKER